MPNFPYDFQLYDEQGFLFSEIDSKGRFVMHVDEFSPKDIRFFRNLKELLKSEKPIIDNIEHRISVDELLLDIGPEFEYDLRETQLTQRYDGLAALIPIVEALGKSCLTTVTPYLEEALPNYIIPGLGARGVLNIDRVNDKVKIEQTVSYKFYLIYLDPEETLEWETIRLGLLGTDNIKYKRDNLEIFENFLNSSGLSLPDD